MGAVVAFCCGMRIRIDIKRIVRASLHTGFAADTAVFVEVDDAVVAEKQRFYGADFNAGGIRAVVAAHHGKQPPGVGKYPLFDLFYVCPEYAEGYFVFAFTGRCAGMAPDTLSVVNNESVFHAF
jgi:hypothetical protein